MGSIEKTIVGLGVVVIAAIVGAGYGCSVVMCDDLGTETGRETKYSFTQNECFIKQADGTWTPKKNWRTVE